jgi:hypothetical protein
VMDRISCGPLERQGGAVITEGQSDTPDLFYAAGLD